MISRDYKVCGSLVLHNKHYLWNDTSIVQVAEELKHAVAHSKVLEYGVDWWFGDPVGGQHGFNLTQMRGHNIRGCYDTDKICLSGPDALIDLLSYCGLWQIRELSAPQCYDLLGRGWVHSNILEHCVELTGYDNWQDVFHKILLPVYTNYERFDIKEKFIAFMHVYKLPGVLLLYRNLVRMAFVQTEITAVQNSIPQRSHLLRRQLDEDCLLYGVVMRHSVL